MRIRGPIPSSRLEPNSSRGSQGPRRREQQGGELSISSLSSLGVLVYYLTGQTKRRRPEPAHIYITTVVARLRRLIEGRCFRSALPFPPSAHPRRSRPIQYPSSSYKHANRFGHTQSEGKSSHFRLKTSVRLLRGPDPRDLRIGLFETTRFSSSSLWCRYGTGKIAGYAETVNC